MYGVGVAGVVPVCMSGSGEGLVEIKLVEF